MSKRRKAKTMTDQLKQAVADSGQTLYRVAKDSGVDYSVLIRFMAGERSIGLETAGKLAAYLGLELRPVRKGG